MANLNYIKPNGYTETFDAEGGNQEYHFKSQCRGCKKIFEITVKGQDLFNYHNHIGHIQDNFPYLTPGQRELLCMSGLCDTCFDNLFSEEES